MEVFTVSLQRTGTEFGKNIIKRLQKSSESKKSILLNNDHGMLPNGKFLMEKMLRKA
jgi:hypothetical protein